MISNVYVANYIELYRSGKIKLNKERIDLVKYLEKYVLSDDGLYFDDDRIDKCIKFGEKWYFPLEDFQRFLIAFIFLYYKKNDRAFYRKFLWMLGRGGGKNGLITVVTHFLISELHGVEKYNISIVANSEEQAKTSFEEAYDAIGKSEILTRMFYRTKVQITDNKTHSALKFRTSNGETKDGLRDGAVVFDEIHQYETNKDVRVHISGLGKKKDPREFYIGTDGYVREGFLDKLKEKARNVLNGSARPNALFPFICKLDSVDEVNDTEMWEKANPMFCLPLSAYAETLFFTVKEEYEDLNEDPSNREEFFTKRMNLPVEDLTKSVAPWSEILRTGYEEDGFTPRPMPDLTNRLAVGGLDFASVKDFAACGVLFRHKDDYVWKTHSFVRKGFLDSVKLKAPIKEWEQQGLLTILDEPVIDMQNIVNWFCEMRELYGLDTIVADTFRLDLVKSALEAEGFRIIYIRNPKAASAKLAPRIETLFAQNHLIYGDNPLMRWYTNNVMVKIDKFGNKSYEKKDEYRRKTDGFMALIYAFWEADNILMDEEAEFVLNDLVF